MPLLTDKFFKSIMPSVPADLRAEYAKWCNLYCYQLKINTEKRISACFGQLYEESGGFTRTVENLNYSAGRLMTVWHKRFPTTAIAQQYAHQPEKLANYVYGGRNGNRPGTDDGWVYRGRDWGQTTGRGNYETLTKDFNKMGFPVDFVKNPDLAATVQYAVLAGLIEFALRGCNELADKWDLVDITKKINGGTNGLADRKAISEKCRVLLPDDFRLGKSDDNERSELSGTVPEPPAHALAPDMGTPGFLPDEETNAGSTGESDGQEVSEPGGTPENASNGQQTPAIGASVKAEITPEGGVKVESSQGNQPPQQRVAVVKEVPKAWYSQLGAKITTVVTGNALFQWLQSSLDSIQALGIPTQVWWIIGIIIGVGSMFWIGNSMWENYQENKAQKELDKLLVEQNSTPENLAQLIPATQVELYRARGFKIITRGDPSVAPPPLPVAPVVGS